ARDADRLLVVDRDAEARREHRAHLANQVVVLVTVDEPEADHVDDLRVVPEARPEGEERRDRDPDLLVDRARAVLPELRADALEDADDLERQAVDADPGADAAGGAEDVAPGVVGDDGDAAAVAHVGGGDRPAGGEADAADRHLRRLDPAYVRR